MRNIVSPAYQPILDLRTSRISHYEALARVNEDTRQTGHVELIKMGERVGFISLIDIAMLEHAFELLSMRNDIVIAANISMATIERASNDVLSLVYRHYENARRLIIEITETVEILDYRRLEKFISALRHAGCRIALDDFGAGYFTVEHVAMLKPEFVKLDGSLVAELSHGLTLPVICIADTVRVYGGELIGEMVDSEEKLAALKLAGVQYAQGFLIGRPSKQLQWNDCIGTEGIVVEEIAHESCHAHF